MEKVKAKDGYHSLRPYWYLYIPLTLILFLMVFFPIRIHIDPFYSRDFVNKFVDEIVFYGVILFFALFVAVKVISHFRKRSKLLVFLALVCVLLAGWQIFDVTVLRGGNSSGLIAATYYGVSPHFYDDSILCHTISEREIRIGEIISIAYDINRYDSWPVCGG